MITFIKNFSNVILVDWVQSEDIVQKTRRQEIFRVNEVKLFTQVCQLLDSVFWGDSEHHHQELLQELNGNFKELSETSNDPREGWKGMIISGRLKCIGLHTR